MLEIEYLNCEIDNGQFVLSFDFPAKIGSRILPAIVSGDMTDYVKIFKQAVEIRDKVVLDLGFMVMLNKAERHQVVMALGIDNTLESLLNTCIKYSEKDKNMLGYIYSKSLDFYFIDVLNALESRKSKAVYREDFVESIKLDNIIASCRNTFEYLDKQLDSNKVDFRELYYEDITIFEYDTLESLTDNEESK